MLWSIEESVEQTSRLEDKQEMTKKEKMVRDIETLKESLRLDWLEFVT